MAREKGPDRPVSRADIEAKLREIKGEVDETATSAKPIAVAVGGFVGAATMTSPPLPSFASPQITWTLFFLRRPPTPILRRPETARERCTTAFASKPTFSAERP